MAKVLKLYDVLDMVEVILNESQEERMWVDAERIATRFNLNEAERRSAGHHLARHVHARSAGAEIIVIDTMKRGHAKAYLVTKRPQYSFKKKSFYQ